MRLKNKLYLLAFACLQIINVHASSRPEAFCNVPGDLIEPLSAYMRTHCAEISCENVFFFCPATPEDYEKTAPEFAANLADETDPKRYFYCLPTDLRISCLLHLLTLQDNNLHPSQFYDEQSAQRDFSFYKKNTDETKTLLGYWHLQTNKTDPTKTSFARYIRKEHRGNGYSTIMHKGILAYLETLKGQRLHQYKLKKDLDLDGLLRNPQPLKISCIGELTEQPYTGVVQYISLNNPESFMAAARQLTLTDVRRLWEPRKTAYNHVYYGVPEEIREITNALLVFSDTPAGEPSPELQEMQATLLAYVTTPAPMREEPYKDLLRVVLKNITDATPVLFPEKPYAEQP